MNLENPNDVAEVVENMTLQQIEEYLKEQRSVKALDVTTLGLRVAVQLESRLLSLAMGAMENTRNKKKKLLAILLTEVINETETERE